MGSLGVSDETRSVDNLRAGSHPTIQSPVTIASGAGALVAGTVLGRITATGEFDEYDDDGDDNGCRTAVCILAVDVDATSEAVAATAYRHGEFNEDDLTGIDAAGILDLELRGIYVTSNVA
jgi:hypothetical protein